MKEEDRPLRKKGPNPSTVEQCIIQIVKEENTATVEEIIKLIQQKHSLSQKEIMKYILNLQRQGKLNLKEKPFPSSPTIRGYFLSPQIYWYWITISLAMATLAAVLIIPKNSFPALYIQSILGAIYVLWLPGYSFTKALFPTRVPISTGKKELDHIERIVLSVGMSLALVPLVGLILYYTPWEITLVTITLSLLAVTVPLSTIALIRGYQTTRAIV